MRPIVLIGCVLVNINFLSGQSIDGGYGHYGAMIYLRGNVPAGDVEIRRTGGGQSYEARVFKIRPVENVEQFLLNVEKLPAPFKGLFPFTAESATYYLEKLKGASTIESIPMSQTPNVLFALGLAVRDTTVMTYMNYSYQLYVNGVAASKELAVQTTLDEDDGWKPGFYSGTNNERIIRCRWSIPYERKSEVYSYVAYRTAPFNSDYQPVSGISSFFVSGDTILAVFMDTTSLYAPGIYQYKIRTIDRFGRWGPMSDYGEGSNFTPVSEPVMVYFDAQGLNDKPAIKLQWRILNDWRIRAMTLYRSRSYAGPYEMVGHFSAQDSSYIDPVTDVMESYFYYFDMQDIAQETPISTAKVTSVSRYQVPAEVPFNVVTTSEGPSIHVSWQRASHQDRGYYVLRTEGYGTPEKIVSPFISASDNTDHYSWTDTTALEPDEYYTYAVISESIGYVKSALSEVVSARPDVPVYIPAPSNLSISRQDDTTFLLSWKDMSADESNNHLGYRVYQKDVKAKDGYRLLTPEMLVFETNFILLHHITPEDAFMVRAYNIFGNESTDSELISLHEPYFYKFGPEYLMGKNETTGIRLRWNHPVRSDIARYKLYRVGADKKMTLLTTVKESETSFLDTKVKAGMTYYYVITAETKRGLASEASEVLQVKR